MGRMISVQACERAVQELLVELPRPERKALATDPSKERRAQRLLDATITGASACYPGVVSLVFALARGRARCR
jgi:hypothetical protein